MPAIPPIRQTTHAAAALPRAARAPADAASLAAFRIAFGLAALLIIARFFAHGWIDQLYIEPTHHFTYPGLGWIQPWPQWGMHAHFAALAILAVGITLGYRYRLCAALFFAGFVYIELLDKTAYLNHYYLFALLSLLTIFLPLHRSLSLDAWRQSRTLWGQAPAGTLWLLRTQLALVYIFAGAAKLNPDWLLHAQPLRIWLQDHAALPLIGPILAEPWTAYAFSWSGALFDLTIVAWLLWLRSRPIAYIILALFHLATYLLFPQIGVFPWLMTAAALIFFPPDWPRQIGQHLRPRQPDTAPSLAATGIPPAATAIPAAPSPAATGIPPAPSPAATAIPATPSAPGNANPIAAPHPRNTKTPNPPHHRQRRSIPKAIAPLMPAATAIAIALYLAAQIALPLRHYAYPGNVRWNDEGYRFAWRVLLTEKVGMVEYRVHDPATGQSWRLTPDQYLTPLQAERMTTQPDLILETAHLIARDFAARGHPQTQIRADAFVAMNARPNARLIDPQTDLAAAKPGLTPKQWLLPQPQP